MKLEKDIPVDICVCVRGKAEWPSTGVEDKG